ncbi:MAG: pyruvate kinase, partial [Tepidiformaceae bacterium]
MNMSRENPNRRTKIVATLGPASLHPEKVAAMLRAGMDVARLNTSHGTIEEHLRACDLVRTISAEENKPVAV